ncbi:MAG: hypothetical protein H7833_16150 [Magnetococcus sp. DMHC-1]
MFTPRSPGINPGRFWKRGFHPRIFWTNKGSRTAPRLWLTTTEEGGPDGPPVVVGKMPGPG